MMQAVRHARYMRLGINSTEEESVAHLDFQDSLLIDLVIWEQDLYEEENQKKWIKNLNKGNT